MVVHTTQLTLRQKRRSSFLPEFIEDVYNGITISKNSINRNSFNADLKELIAFANGANKSLIWLTLSSKDGAEIATALDLGFQFNSCSESKLVLVLKLQDVYVPFMPTHTVGVGGIVIADNKIVGHL